MTTDRLLRFATLLSLALLLSTWTAPCVAELENHGADGEYFHDTNSGLYWFDPGIFCGNARATTDLLSTWSTTWTWATSAQIDALVGQVAEAGLDLEDVMATRLTTIANGGPRWVGFYAESDPDGWLLQSEDSPDFTTVTTTGSQGGAAALSPGAWLVASVEPVAATAVLENCGPTGEYFHDRATGLYWYDPAEFYGTPRADVVAWLAANTDWRWATAGEVYGLLGKTSVDGGELDGIIGNRLTTIGSGGPRWVGFYDQAGEPTGILIEAGIAPSFNMLDAGGTQGGAEGLGAGAWIVTSTDPTPIDQTTWGEIKRTYR